MAQQLFPTFPEITIYDQSAENTNDFVPAYSFDFEKGDFALDGAGRIVICDGIEGWQQWCQKTLCTQRESYASYDDDIGVNGEEAMLLPTRKAQESHLERTIREALMVHPCTQAVKDFKFAYDADSVHITCRVEGKDYANFSLEQNYTV